MYSLKEHQKVRRFDSETQSAKRRPCSRRKSRENDLLGLTVNLTVSLGNYGNVETQGAGLVVKTAENPHQLLGNTMTHVLY